VHEQPGSAPGILYDRTVYTVTVTVSEQGGKLSAALSVSGGPDGAAVFENTYEKEPEKEYGSLTVKKTVSGDLASKSEVFTFTLKLGAPGSYAFTKDEIRGFISDGDTFRLSHGESLTVWDLPAGTRYEVTETDSRGYRSYSRSASGEISADGSTAEFVNTLSSVPQTGDRSPLLLWGAVCIASGAAVTALTILRKKRRE